MRLLSPLLSNNPITPGRDGVFAGQTSGQGRGRTADLPLFRMKDDSPGPAM
jgi:hypothetical protein